MPALPTHAHKFDWLGVALSGAGMFLLVFGIQEGHQYDWGRSGTDPVWRLIIAGIVVLAALRRSGRPATGRAAGAARPVPRPQLLAGQRRDHAMGFAITAMAFPLMLYAQAVRGLSPTRSALLLVPMAVMSIVLAPLGRQADRPGRTRGYIAAFGFAGLVGSLFWLSA